jgi:hypothetical protein
VSRSRHLRDRHLLGQAAQPHRGVLGVRDDLHALFDAVIGTTSPPRSPHLTRCMPP